MCHGVGCVQQVERFRVASEKLEGELSESRLEHDRMAASLALAQLTATELEKVATEHLIFILKVMTFYN